MAQMWSLMQAVLQLSERLSRQTSQPAAAQVVWKGLLEEWESVEAARRHELAKALPRRLPFVPSPLLQCSGP